MDHLDIVLPIILLFLAFILKLSIDRSIEVPNLIQAICELPVDMEFLSISFLIAFTIGKDTDTGKGLFFCFVYICIAVIVVILWRKCLKLFEKGNKLWILLLCINIAFSSFSLFQSMNVLLKKDVTSNVKTEINSKNNKQNGN